MTPLFIFTILHQHTSADSKYLSGSLNSKRYPVWYCTKILSNESNVNDLFDGFRYLTSKCIPMESSPPITPWGMNVNTGIKSLFNIEIIFI
jgi:hypothetical protein